MLFKRVKIIYEYTKEILWKTEDLVGQSINKMVDKTINITNSMDLVKIDSVEYFPQCFQEKKL